MAPIPPIFTLDIPAYKSATHEAPAGGTIILTQAAPKIYLLTFTSGPDNRLTPPFLDTLSLALDIILTLPPGVVITTSGIPKFYSNGLDYAGAISNPNFMTDDLFPVWRKLLSFPWPTVSLINGHAFAGGLMTAMAHDYRIMNPHKGFLCLNEVDFNAPLAPPMATLFRVKTSMNTFRTLVLEGKRLNALAAVEVGLVDGVGGVDEAVKIIGELGLPSKLREVGTGSYGTIKEEMYREIIADLDSERTTRENGVKDKQSVDDWKSKGGKLNVPPKSKL